MCKGLAIEVDVALHSPRVTRVLDQAICMRGKPDRISSGNGLEGTDHRCEDWARNKNIEIEHTQPGKPMQNAFIERFNGTRAARVQLESSTCIIRGYGSGRVSDR